MTTNLETLNLTLNEKIFICKEASGYLRSCKEWYKQYYHGGICEILIRKIARIKDIAYSELRNRHACYLVEIFPELLNFKPLGKKVGEYWFECYDAISRAEMLENLYKSLLEKNKDYYSDDLFIDIFNREGVKNLLSKMIEQSNNIEIKEVDLDKWICENI